MQFIDSLVTGFLFFKLQAFRILWHLYKLDFQFYSYYIWLQSTETWFVIQCLGILFYIMTFL